MASEKRKKIVINNNHIDYSGGGIYMLQLAKCLSAFGDVYFDCEQTNDITISGINLQILKYDHSFIPDLFVASSHWGNIEPIGNINAHVIYFPQFQGDYPLKYDYLITLNEFVSYHTNIKYPGKKFYIINPSIDADKYSVSKKQNQILNVGNFFKESDGHSKNQHIILEWFIQNKLYEEYKMVFTGFVSNQDYFNELHNRAKKFPNILIKSNIPRSELISLYSESKFLIHANGYKRNNFYQTEHYGIIAIEAMISGCQPVVHNSGGCRDFKGVRVWEELDEILPLLYETKPEKLREYGNLYSFSNMIDQTRNFLNNIGVI